MAKDNTVVYNNRIETDGDSLRNIYVVQKHCHVLFQMNTSRRKQLLMNYVLSPNLSLVQWDSNVDLQLNKKATYSINISETLSGGRARSLMANAHVKGPAVQAFLVLLCTSIFICNGIQHKSLVMVVTLSRYTLNPVMIKYLANYR